jgi:hypothetical protein
MLGFSAKSYPYAQGWAQRGVIPSEAKESPLAGGGWYLGGVTLMFHPAVAATGARPMALNQQRLGVSICRYQRRVLK